jgi:twinkle protein
MLNQTVRKKLENAGITVRKETGTDKLFCPKCHSERKNKRDKSLSVVIESPNAAYWKCHNCGYAGRADTFTYERKEHKPIEARGLTLDDTMFAYFGNRGITREVVNRNRITYNPRNPRKEESVPSICFPYAEGAEIYNYKFKTLDKRFFQVQGGKKLFFKINDAIDQNEVIITEGEEDALSWEVAGIPYAISVPDGAPAPNAEVSDKKFEYIDNCYHYLEKAERIYLATDADEPGIRLRMELSRRLGAERCYIIRFPDDCKDSNECLVKHGKEVLLKCKEEAEPMPVKGVTYANDYQEQVREVMVSGWPDGKRCGYSDMDEHLPLFPGFWIVTGAPTHGKTTWLDQYCLAHALANRVKIAMYSPENPPVAHIVPMMQRLLGKPIEKNINNISDETTTQALDFINDHFFYIQPEEEGISAVEIVNRAKALVRSKGIEILIIDPWNTLNHRYEKGEDRLDYISRVLGMFSHLSKSLSITVILVAHPRKLESITAGGGTKNMFKKPTLYDISGSADFYNKADIGVSVYRDFDDMLTKVSVQKVKFAWTGKMGTIELRYDKETCRFLEPGLRGDNYPPKFLSPAIQFDTISPNTPSFYQPVGQGYEEEDLFEVPF